MLKNQVLVLGNDHTNTTGVVQCLGREGFTVSAVVWGAKSGIVASSKYVSQIFSALSPEECVELICNKFKGKDAIIIACSDAAAIALERKRKSLFAGLRFEHTTGEWSIEELCEKSLQVKLAKEAGFNVPWSSSPIESTEDVPCEVPFPCITKSLVSCKGSKSDLTVVKSQDSLKPILERLLSHTPKILLQQYIERDYEISILGCGLRNGECIIPCVENKLTLYPKNVGLECLANMQPLEDENIIQPIRTLIKRIGYVGLFSVEMMHSKIDGKFYFTEINLRNDGANSFVYKYGVNLPLNHIEDLLGHPITKFSKFHPGYYIWEIHHSLSLVHRELRVKQWIKELRMSKGFLLYFPEDKTPFFKQYKNWILSTLHLRKNESY
jgi:predicted ATP-grasp superfamily ATP-dependent carboligase